MGRNQYFEDQRVQIAAGQMLNVDAINKFGFNDTVPTDWELIQVGSANITYPTTAAVASVVSDDSNDAAAGNGARTVSIQGLDANYDRVTETVTMNGTNAVTTNGTFIRVFRVRVETGGSNGGAEGTITVSVGGNAQVTLDPEYDNQSLHAAYTVPRGYNAFLMRMQATSTKDNKAAMVAITAKSFGDDTVFQIKQLIEIYRNSVTVDFPVPLKFEEKTDIEMRGKNLNTGNVSIGGTFDLILVKK